MKTNRLRQFCVVFETKNLRKAAEILNLSHSALSKSLKVLQQEIGRSLFKPDGRGIGITDEAARLYPVIKIFLNQEAALFSLASPPAPTCRIGTFEVFSTHLLASLWEKYFKGLHLELHELLPGKLERALVESKIDVAITYEPIPHEDLSFTKIGKTKMQVFTTRGRLQQLKLNQLPFVAPVAPIEGTPTGAKGLDGWPSDKYPRNVVYKVDMVESGLALARSGRAAIFLPSFVARLHNLSAKSEYSLVEYDSDRVPLVSRNIYLVTRKASEENHLLRSLAKLIRNECLEK